MSTDAAEMIAIEDERPIEGSSLRAYCWTCLLFAGVTTLAFYVMLSNPNFEV